MSRPDREKKLDREHPWLSIRRQCTLLSLARSGVYRERKRTSPEELVVMRKIDELFLSRSLPGGAADRPDARAGRLQGEPQAGQTADAGHGAGGARPQAAHQQARPGPQHLPLSLEGHGRRMSSGPRQPGRAAADIAYTCP